MATAVAIASPVPTRARSSTSAASPFKFEPPRSEPAEILLFPIVRRPAFIARAADAWERYSPKGAQRYLQVLIDRHAKRLARLGIDPERVAADLRDLKAAVGMTDYEVAS
jgi:hypothetical protein